MIALPYPVSANRYWRHNRGRVMRSEAAEAYRRTVAAAAWVAGWRVLDGPVAVRLVLRPRATQSGAASRVRLDLDNCLKVVLDALNGVAYRDDGQIVHLVAHVGPPIAGGGLTVRVRRR